MHGRLQRVAYDAKVNVLNCQKCNSTRWKLCPVIYAEGLTSVDTHTSGSALGAGVASAGLGMGYARASASTSGSHQTSLSKAAAPPEVPPHPGHRLSKAQQHSALLLFQLAGCLVFVIWAFGEGGFFIGLGALAFVWFLMSKFWGGNKNADREYEEYEQRYEVQFDAHQQGKEAYERWERTGICLRCGNRFEPSSIGEAATANDARVLSDAGETKPLSKSKNAPIFACSKCGVGNRVPKERIDEEPTCGSCGFPLFV